VATWTIRRCHPYIYYSSSCRRSKSSNSSGVIRHSDSTMWTSCRRDSSISYFVAMNNGFSIRIGVSDASMRRKNMGREAHSEEPRPAQRCLAYARAGGIRKKPSRHSPVLRQTEHRLEDLRLLAQQRLVDAKQDGSTLVGRSRGQHDIAVRNPVMHVALRCSFWVHVHRGRRLGRV